MSKPEVDREVDRLMELLRVGTEAVRRGDGDSALLAVQEALATAKRLPQKPDVIALPDQSEKPSC